jgi:hypothetical protein
LCDELDCVVVVAVVPAPDEELELPLPLAAIATPAPASAIAPSAVASQTVCLGRNTRDLLSVVGVTTMETPRAKKQARPG